jgi:hypothetical protein
MFMLIIPIISTAEEIDTNRVCFHWAFVYKDKAGSMSPVDFNTQINNLQSGDRLKIYLKPVHNAYIYLILYDSQKELFLLFPNAEKGFFYNYQIGKEYLIPEKRIWFYLKNDSGMEIFHLIVSRTRCKKLEEVMNEYLSLMEKKPVSETILNNAKQAVLEEIRILKKRNSIFQGLNEKPLSIAGDFRGDKQIHQYIFMIEVENFYAKTFRVAH